MQEETKQQTKQVLEAMAKMSRENQEKVLIFMNGVIAGAKKE